MRRASGLVMADLANALGSLELKISEASVMLVMWETPGSTQSSIGKQLGIQRANMAPLMANLVQRGLVERIPSVGRSTNLVLTPAGAALKQAVRDLVTTHEDRVFGALGALERRTLKQLLAKVWKPAKATAL